LAQSGSFCGDNHLGAPVDVTEAITLLRKEPQTRLFFAALAQSSLGTGAGYIALLVIAYERFHSPWAISLILLADFLPAMFLAPVLGAAADRWSRRWCAVVADIVRAGAFLCIPFVGSFEATLVLALVAGLGTALFRPAVLASLPSLVAPDRSAAVTSLYGAVTDMGFTVGPALAAAGLAAVGTEELLFVNGVTFGVSAVILARLPFGAVGRGDAAQRGGALRSLFSEAWEGLRVSARMPVVRVVVAAFGGAMFFGGIYNVIELPFSTDALGTTSAGYSGLVAVYGVGFILGSLRGSGGGGPELLKRRFLQGFALTGIGGVLTGLAPTLPLALAGFALGGFGNGVFVVHQRLLLQAMVEPRMQGRVFAVTDTLMSWGLALAFVSGGVLLELTGSRALMLLTGAGEIALAGLSFVALRSSSERVAVQAAALKQPGLAISSPLGAGGELLGHLHLREEGADVVRGSGFWLTLLDDLRERDDHVGIELSSGVRR
jgi:MFS family permease